MRGKGEKKLSPEQRELGKMAIKREVFIKIKKHMPKKCWGMYVSYKYKKIMGKKCNLKNPRTYTEKIQWSKINRNDPMISRLSDKVAVRSWVEENIGGEYLIPTIGKAYSSADDIDYDSLPNSFVIKANHGSGLNVVVDGKKEISFDDIKDKANSWLKQNFAYNSFEMQYKDIRPQIYIEKNLLEDCEGDLPDYKFFCFGGKVYCLYVMINTYPIHTNAKLGIFDKNFNLLPYYRADFTPITKQIEKPANYSKMIEIAEKLSEGFSHVRVDLYNVNGKIYFGEMTFSTGSGLFKHVPEEFDEILGNQWDLESGI